MGLLAQSLIEENKERRWIGIITVVSVVVHFLVLALYASDWLGPRASNKDEWAIETELVFDMVAGDEAVDSVRSREKAETLKVEKNILPQLPKQFKIAAAPVVVDKDAMPSPEDKRANQKKLDREQAKQKSLRTAQVKAQRSALELKKKDALQRLLKEEARRRKQFAKASQAPDPSQMLVSRKETLTARIDSGQMSAGVRRYNKVLKSWVQRHYVLPEIYANAGRQKSKAVVEIILTQQGAIKKLKVIKSSSDHALDNLALATMRKAAPFPKPPQELVGRPILYRFDTNI